MFRKNQVLPKIVIGCSSLFLTSVIGWGAECFIEMLFSNSPHSRDKRNVYHIKSGQKLVGFKEDSCA